jgi:hypothetical protein
MQFRPFEKNIEVNGQTVYAIIDGFKLLKSIAYKYLTDVGIGTFEKDGTVRINPSAWYSQESWLKAFENISKGVGNTVLYQIGLTIPRNAKFPPWVVDVDSAVKSIDIAYHMNHKKNGKEMFDVATGKMTEGIGHYGYQRVEGKNMIISVCENPYPCDFDRGILTFMAKKFQPDAEVKHDDSKPCRKKGQDSCTYIITW